MRIMIAFLLALPVYYALGGFSPIFFCVIGLQLLAGIDFKLFRKEGE